MSTVNKTLGIVGPYRTEGETDPKMNGEDFGNFRLTRYVWVGN